ncbi:MAG TPA: CHAT domain-containing protein [Pyrinomonadaceae bacterium]|jgi:hypothetical protein
MDQQEDIPEFKVVIKSDKLISVQHTHLPTLADIKDEEVNLDPLKKSTTLALIGMLRDNRLKREIEFEVLGSHLFSTLFYKKDGTLNGIGAALHTAVDFSRRSKILRVQLVFESDDIETSLLSKWPWEYLYSPAQSYPAGRPGTFLAKLTRLVLVRYLPTGSPIRALQVEKPPVKVLFVAASAKDLPQVQYDSVLEELQDLEKRSEDTLKVYTLLGDARQAGDDPDAQYATFDRFLDMLTSIEPHVIHFVGHGRIHDESGEIAFMHEDGSAHWINEDDFAANLWDLCRDELRLVFLQACETAALSNPYEAVSGVAQQLARMNIPAVVAMQYEVANQIANTFARAFYGALADSKYIDEAVQFGRQKITSAGRAMSNLSYTFTLPVLYMRQPGGLLAPASGIASPNRPSTGPVFGGSVPAPGRLCPYCQTPATSASAKICGNCRAKLICSNCNEVVRGKLNYCENCAYSLTYVEDERGAEADQKTISLRTQLKIQNDRVGLQTGSERK